MGNKLTIWTKSFLQVEVDKGESWDLRVYMDVINSLETGCKRAVEIMRESLTQERVKQATDLIQSEVQHLLKVMSNVGKNPKVSTQSKLNFICLGKTKKSDEIILPSYRQMKLTKFFKKPKSVKRKLVISSSESEEISGKMDDKNGDDSPLEDCPSLEDDSMDQVENGTILASGPMKPPSPPSPPPTNVS